MLDHLFSADSFLIVFSAPNHFEISLFSYELFYNCPCISLNGDVFYTTEKVCSVFLITVTLSHKVHALEYVALMKANEPETAYDETP